MTAKAIMVLGTGSSVGKSLIVAGLCRYFANKGIKCAPFKPQNMSLNSTVIPGGKEIARAQFGQAFAARTNPSALMNPILLKPLGNKVTELIICGIPKGHVEITSYYRQKKELLKEVIDAFFALSLEYDLIIVEGAGSPAEINLADVDIANNLFASALKIPCIIVGDIDKGGVFASLFGTYSLVNQNVKQLIKGFLINKFRGDESLLKDGFTKLYKLTNVPTLGVIPFIEKNFVDSEDSLSNEVIFSHKKNYEKGMLGVGIIKTPFMSNAADFDPLVLEDNLNVTLTSNINYAFENELVIIPGSKATVSDLNWLKENGIDEKIEELKNSNKVLLGICGGYQMLGQEILNDFESNSISTKALGLLRHHTIFTEKKVLKYLKGHAFGQLVTGFEMHFGTIKDNSSPWITYEDGHSEGNCDSNIYGTLMHSIFDQDNFRTKFLGQVAQRNNVSFIPDQIGFFEKKNIYLDELAEILKATVDLDAIYDIAMGYEP